MQCNEMSKEELTRIAAEAGAKVAIETMERERKKYNNTRRDRRLHNTRLLLRHYRRFKLHAQNAVYDAKSIDRSAYDIMDLMDDRHNSDTFVDSIKDSVVRTALIVEHIEVMIKLYETFCLSSGNPEEERRCRVLKATYIDETSYSVSELAERENVAHRTIYRDIKAASAQVAALIFGIDGIRKD